MTNERKTVTCRGCGAPIFFLKTPQGRNHPVDANPVKVWIRPTDNPDAWVLAEGYVSHFATCPQAEAFRNRGTISKSDPDGNRVADGNK
jgi:hypothetical protein